MAARMPLTLDSNTRGLAFIFIPKMRDLIALKETVPPMQVAPAAEVYLTSAWEIVKKLRIIDGIASQRSL